MCLEETMNGRNTVIAYHVTQGSRWECETSLQSSLSESAMAKNSVVWVEPLSSICHRRTGF